MSSKPESKKSIINMMSRLNANKPEHEKEFWKLFKSAQSGLTEANCKDCPISTTILARMKCIVEHLTYECRLTTANIMLHPTIKDYRHTDYQYTEPCRLKTFIFYFYDGSTAVYNGLNALNALTRHGFTSDSISSDMNTFEEQNKDNPTARNFKYVPEKKCWQPISQSTQSTQSTTIGQNKE